MPVRSCIRGTICKCENGTLKVARNAFNIGEVWNQFVAMVTKLLSSYCRAPLEESYCKEFKLAEISFLIIFDQNLVECMTSHLPNLHILKTLIYLE